MVGVVLVVEHDPVEDLIQVGVEVKTDIVSAVSRLLEMAFDAL